MIRSTWTRVLLATLQLAALVALPGIALAGQRYRRPPDVDLDPDRGMPFDRLPKTAFDNRELDAMKKTLALHAMDPTVDPYGTVVKPNKYDAYTGQIRGSLSDAMREMRHEEDVSRQFSGDTKSVTPSPFAPPNPLARMPTVDRLRRNLVVDPVVALKKKQLNDQKHDDSDD